MADILDLTVIEDDHDAWRLMGTWKRVHHLKGSRRQRLWAQLTGVPESKIESLEVRLLGNGFLLPDGTVDPLAHAYASAMFKAGLPAEMRREAGEKPVDRGE